MMVDMGTASPPETLLERRRREMQDEIRRASLRLVTELGICRVTVEAVSAAVGISPRTFFNYFPNKEAALVHAPAPLDPRAVEEFVAGSGGTETILDDLGELLAGHLDAAPPDRAALRAVFAAAREHPPLIALQLARMEEFERELRAVIAQRLGDEDADAPAPDPAPELLAAVAMGTVRVAMQRWSRDPTAPAPGGHARDAFADLRRLLSESPSMTPPTRSDLAVAASPAAPGGAGTARSR